MATPPPAPAPGAGWYLLIHQLPPRPIYLRAKVRRRLERVGAVAIKNSVYVLPATPACLEDFQWIAQEAMAGGGEASIWRADVVEGLTTAGLIERFRADASARYKPLVAALETLLRQARRASGGGHAGARLLQLRRQVREVSRTDFFGANAGREVEALMTAIERRRRARPAGGRAGARPAGLDNDLTGRVWVTRADPHVDRLATAWLVRRFVDPAARFRFVERAGGVARPEEISFDMVGATFGHEADRCTFETLVARLRLADPALRAIGEIVHDIDLKDGRYGRPDASGIDQMVLGLVESHPDSALRIAAALPFFDALYASFGGRLPGAAGASRGRARAGARKR